MVCDLCGESHDGGLLPRDSTNWESGGMGDFDNIEISRTRGHSYPGDYYRDGVQQFDICPECWENKLLPWLKSQGADLRGAYTKIEA